MTRNIVLLAFLIAGCVSRPVKVAEVQSNRIGIQTMNVENLFDTDDDPDKNDETFLPASLKTSQYYQNKCRAAASSEYRAEECLDMDWNEDVLDRKLRRLTDVLEQVNDGYGPDVLILQEVENRKVLEKWRDRYLKKMNYQTISHIDSPDERGIDTALMSRLPMIGEPKLHLLDYSKEPSLTAKDQRPTRGILETHLRLPNGQEIIVFAVHFPSQGAPTIHRKVAVETLLEITSKVPPEIPVVVGGDFNITSREEFKERYFRNLIAPRFSVSHLVGCPGCAGTTYWWRDKTWSFFDVLLFSKGLDRGPGGNGGWALDRESIHIVNSSVYQTNRWGAPAHFGGGRNSVGVTDHWSMYADLVLANEKKSEAVR